MVVNTINELIALLDLVDQDATVLAAIANDSPTSLASGPSEGLVTTRLGTDVKNVQKVIADIKNGILIGIRPAIQEEGDTILDNAAIWNFVGGNITVTDISGVATITVIDAFNATFQAKLSGIEASADVTDAANVTAAGALMDSELTDIASVKALDQGVAEVDTPTFAGIITSGNVDGRDVAADGTKLDYVTVTQAVNLDTMETDINALSDGMTYEGDWDASSGTFPGAGAAATGGFYYVFVDGIVDNISFTIGDNIVAIVDNASTSIYASNWSKHDQTDAVSAVVGLTGSVSKSGLLAGLNVEDGATADQTGAEIATALSGETISGLILTGSLTTGALTASGIITADAGLVLGDNDKIKLGDSDDLQLYHDGSNSYIKNTTGQIFINKSGPSNAWVCGVEAGFTNPDDTEFMVRATSNGPVKLYHNGSEKLATSASGIDVTGNVTATGLTTDFGTIGVVNANNMFICGTATNHAGVQFGTGNVTPYNNGSQNDGGVDLGAYNLRWNNLYLSGVARLGTGTTYATIEGKSNSDLEFTANAGQINGAPNITFRSSNAGGSITEHLRIDNSGNVSITSGDLDVTGDVDLTTNLKIGGTTVLNSGRSLYNLTQIKLADSYNMIFGSGNDLKIYHDGANSHITSTTGVLNITSDDLRLKSSGGAETMLRAVANGAVELMHNNDQKIVTTATGVDVTGTVTADGLTSSSAEYDFSALTLSSAAGGGANIDFTLEVGDTGISGLYSKNLVIKGSSGSSDIAFSPSTSYPGLMVLDGSAGNVGIGTSNPLYKLDISGTTNTIGVRVSSNTANDTLYYGTGTVTGDMGFFGSNISATGNLSGTVQNTNTSVGNAVLSTNVPASSSGDPYLDLTINGAVNWTVGVDNSDSDKFKIGPNSSPSNGTASLTIDTSGKVGIGTATPDNTLHVRNSDTGVDAAQLTLHGSNDVGYAFSGIRFKMGVHTTGWGADIQGIDAATWQNDLIFRTTILGNATSKPTEKMRITGSGNVGIGVVPEAWNTSVFSGVAQLGPQGVLATTSTTMQTGVNWYYDGAYKRIGTGYASRNYQSDGAHVYETAASGAADSAISWSEALRIDSSGNVSIPSGNLDVTGDINLTDSTPQLLMTDSDTSATFKVALDGVSTNITNSGTNGEVAFHTFNGEKLRIKSTGIDVTGSVNSTGEMRITNPSATSQLYLYGASGQKSNIILNEYGVRSWHVGAGTYTSGKFSISDGSTEFLGIDSSGNVSITSGDLDVTGNVTAGISGVNANNYQIKLLAGTTGLSRFIAGDGSDAGYLDYNHNDDSWSIKTASSERLSITASGIAVTGEVNTSTLLKVGTNDTEYANNYVRFKPTGAAYIDHNTVGQVINFRVSGSSSLDTNALTVSSTGIDVTGTVTADGLTLGSNHRIQGTGLLFVSGSAAVAFEIGVGSEKMRLTSAGLNVDGTLAVDDKVTVEGSTPYLDLKTGSTLRSRLYGDANQTILESKATDLIFKDSSGEVFRTKSGNVGIGENNPLYKLDVDGIARVASQLRLGSIINQYSGDFSVWVANVGEAFTIKPNTGNVGIGTDDPGAKTTIYSSVDNSAVNIRTDSTGLDIVNSKETVNAYSLIRMSAWGLSADAGANDGRYIQTIANGNNDIDMVFGQYLSTSAITEHMRIDGSGNVSIPTGNLAVSQLGTSEVKVTNSSIGKSGVIRAMTSTGDIEVGGLNGSQDLKLLTGGTPRMTIDSSGNVGIGTDDPDYPLEVSGIARAAHFYTNTGSESVPVFAPQGNTNDGIFFPSGGNIGFTTAGAEAMRITSGKVGIGTPTPSGLLHLAKLSNDNPFYMDTYSSNQGHVSTFQFRTSKQNTIGNTHTIVGTNLGRVEWYGNTGSAFVRSGYIAMVQGSSTETDGDLTINAGGHISLATGGSESLHIDNSGNVSITSGDLDVTGKITVGANGYAVVEQDATTVRFKNSSTSGITHLMTHDGGEDIELNPAGWMRIETAGVERLRIDASGNVGIGTDNPLSELHIHDEGGLAQIRLTGTASGADNFIIGQGTTGVTNGGLSIYDVDAAATRLVINSSGNVLVGTSSNSVYNDASGTGIALNAGQIQIAGTGTPLYLNRQGSDGNLVDFRKDGTPVGSIGSNSSGGDPVLDINTNTSSGIMRFLTSGTERLRIDSSGNVGIGVVPKTGAHTTWRNLSIGDSGNIVGSVGAGGIDGLQVIDNAYIKQSTGAWAYLTTDEASRHSLDAGKHTFYVAPSGTADTTISWTNAMTIDNSGLLYSPPTYSNASGGASNVGVSASGEFYRSTSALKYKRNVETMEDSYADAILETRPVWFRSKCEADNPDWGYWGLIAEELAEIDPRLVFWRTDDYVQQEVTEEIVIPAIEAQDAVTGERQVMETIETGSYVNLAGETIIETREVGVTEEAIETVVERQSIALGEVFTASVEGVDEVTETIIVTQAIEAQSEVTETVVITQSVEAQDAVMSGRQVMETIETGTYVNLAGETITETREVGVTEEATETVIERQVAALGEVFTPAIDGIDEVTETVVVTQSVEAQDAVMGERQVTETIESVTYVNLAGETITETQEVGVTEEATETVIERQEIDGIMTEVEVERTVTVAVMEVYEASPAVEAVTEVTEVNVITESVEAIAEVVLEIDVERPTEFTEQQQWRETTAGVMTEVEVERTVQVAVMEEYEVRPAIEAVAEVTEQRIITESVEAVAEVTEQRIITESVEAVAEVVLETDVERPAELEEDQQWREMTAGVMTEVEVERTVQVAVMEEYEVSPAVEAQPELTETFVTAKTVAVPLETPEAEGVQYDRIVPHLINILQRQKSTIADLKTRLTAALQEALARIEALEALQQGQ